MHLKSLIIKNFRLLEDVEVKKLGHVNLIVGKNNSGKSTVLEALALLASGFDPETIIKLTENRNLERHSFSTNLNQSQFNKQKLSIDSFFSNGGVIGSEIFLGNDDFYLSFKYGSLFDSSDEKHQYSYSLGYQQNMETPIRVSSNKEFKHLSIPPNSFIKNSSNDKIPNAYLNYEFIDTNSINIQQLAQEWEDIVLTDAEDAALEMLRIIEPKIKDLAFINEHNHRSPYVRLEGLNRRVALHSMGDGIFRLLQIIIKLTNTKDGFLLIDEFENGLHYSIQPEVWRLIFKLAKRFNIQVFATTHSWDCIESFAQVAKREDLEGVLFRMGRSARKSDKGKVIATEFDEDELYNLTKDKIEVR